MGNGNGNGNGNGGRIPASVFAGFIAGGIAFLVVLNAYWSLRSDFAALRALVDAQSRPCQAEDVLYPHLSDGCTIPPAMPTPSPTTDAAPTVAQTDPTVQNPPAAPVPPSTQPRLRSEPRPPAAQPTPAPQPSPPPPEPTPSPSPSPPPPEPCPVPTLPIVGCPI